MSFPRGLIEEVRLATPGEIRLFESRRKYHKEQLLVAKTHKVATSAITHCVFSPYDSAGESLSSEEKSQTLLVCGGTRVQIYNLEDYSLEAEIADFTDTLQCCRVRQDGKLLITSDSGGFVRIIKADNRQTLRKYKAHLGNVRRADFLLSKSQAVSAGDDAVLNLFDISEEAPMRSIKGIHTDLIRACQGSPHHEQMLLTGSLDGTVKIWDLRLPDTSAAVQTYKHHAGVESATFFHHVPVVAAATGNIVKFWDTRMPQETQELSIANRCHHLGSISDLRVTEDDLFTLSASGDRSVKLVSIGDWSAKLSSEDSVNYEVKRSILSDKRISSCSVSIDRQHFAIGTEDGEISLWKVHDPKAMSRKKRDREEKARVVDGASFFKRGRRAKAKQDDTIVELDKSAVTARFPPAIQRQLQSHQYQKSIRRAVELGSAEAFGVLISELSSRGALEIALRGHTEEEACAFLKYMNTQIRKLSDADLHGQHLFALRTFVDLNQLWLRETSNEATWALLTHTQENLKNELMRAGPLVEVGQLAAELLNMEVLS